ncbi:MAG: DsrE family protein [Nitrospirae bacterium]|nr:DsrE family protein [Nitrospirota bacterium]
MKVDNLLVILRKPPYGTVNAAEAVRHAGAASGFEYKSMLYLIDGGVFTAKKNQDAGDTGFTGLGESLDLMSGEMDIFADKESLEKYSLSEEDLVEGVKIDDGEVLKKAIKEAQSIMIF